MPYLSIALVWFRTPVSLEAMRVEVSWAFGIRLINFVV